MSIPSIDGDKGTVAEAGAGATKLASVASTSDKTNEAPDTAENAEFLSEQGGPDNDNGGNVQQPNGRQLVGGMCADNAAPLRKDRMITPSGCEYLLQYDGTTCPDIQISDTFYAPCFCCPEHTLPSQCLYCQIPWR
ncbi:hypothetical protein Bbelb_214040 [Branchiostoma belcheri]|nr:hypothetical protein Bbelb_214040 [Branchiostoma belcheri]